VCSSAVESLIPGKYLVLSDIGFDGTGQTASDPFSDDCGFISGENLVDSEPVGPAASSSNTASFSVDLLCGSIEPVAPNDLAIPPDDPLQSVSVLPHPNVVGYDDAEFAEK